MDRSDDRHTSIPSKSAGQTFVLFVDRGRHARVGELVHLGKRERPSIRSGIIDRARCWRGSKGAPIAVPFRAFASGLETALRARSPPGP
jgi:hypothetical protein